MSKRKVATKRAPRKHKPATTPKRARRPKVAARAQRKKQALIRGPKDGTAREAAADSAEVRTEANHAPKRESKAERFTADNRARAAVLESILQASLQDDAAPQMRNNMSGRAMDVFLPFASMQAYQARLLVMTQANAQFAFEFVLRLARIKSPLEFWAVIAEFTARRLLTIGKDAKELTAFWRTTAIPDRSALPGR